MSYWAEPVLARDQVGNFTPNGSLMPKPRPFACIGRPYHARGLFQRMKASPRLASPFSTTGTSEK
jgi:hypothetical protein